MNNNELDFSTIYLPTITFDKLAEINLKIGNLLTLSNENSLVNFDFSKEDLLEFLSKKCDEAIYLQYSYLKILHGALHSLGIKRFYDLESNGRVVLYKNPIQKKIVEVPEELYKNLLLYMSEDRIIEAISKFLAHSKSEKYVSVYSQYISSLLIDINLHKSILHNFLKEKNLKFKNFYVCLESQHVVLE